MAKKWLDSIEKRRRIDLKERYRQTDKQTYIQAGRRLDSNILYRSIQSAIPEIPLLGANICGLCAIQAELQAIFSQNFGSQFWGLGGLNKKSKNNVLQKFHGKPIAKKWLDSIEKQKRRSNLKFLQKQPKFRCHGNKSKFEEQRFVEYHTEK